MVCPESAALGVDVCNPDHMTWAPIEYSSSHFCIIPKYNPYVVVTLIKFFESNPACDSNPNFERWGYQKLFISSRLRPGCACRGLKFRVVSGMFLCRAQNVAAGFPTNP